MIFSVRGGEQVIADAQLHKQFNEALVKVLINRRGRFAFGIGAHSDGRGDAPRRGMELVLLLGGGLHEGNNRINYGARNAP